MATVSEAIERWRAEAGTPDAAKRGRNPVFPYVPIINHTETLKGGATRNRTEQVRGFAYITRDEAVQKAQAVIDGRVEYFKRKIDERGARALREQYGLPRELEAANVTG